MALLMVLLSLNAGSSSLKYKLLTMPSETVLAEGSVEAVGSTSDALTQAAQKAIEKCRPHGIGAVAHRVVHGGPDFVTPVRLTNETLETLRGLRPLDPLHNPTETAVIERGLRLLPGIPAVAVFDTAFHQSLPDVALNYALPWELTEKLHLRRYGFHGISYRYVSEKLLAYSKQNAEGTRLIIAHLGSGSSICALQDGKSVDTSMGFTPLEGLVMGTRCGDLDPGLLLYLLRQQNLSPADLDEMLNKQSGLKGLSGISGDVREVQKAAQSGDTHALLALDLFAYRVRKYIGAYAAALGGVDAIAFTGGIGQHSAFLRAKICDNLGFLGVVLDAARNESAADAPTLLSGDMGLVPVWMISTDEETQIAREAFALLTAPP